MTLPKRDFENIVAKLRKCWIPAFSPFVTMFSNLSKNIFPPFEPQSDCRLHLDKFKILLFGKKLIHAMS